MCRGVQRCVEVSRVVQSCAEMCRGVHRCVEVSRDV